MFDLLKESHRHFRPLLAGIAILAAGSVFAQEPGVFISGSDGSDGAFSPNEDTVILVDQPVYHYTTITIPANVRVSFQKTADNYPVVWLATGDVVISGHVDLDGDDGAGSTGGKGGPGGWDGGNGSTDVVANPDITTRARAGQGPGGGIPSNLADARHGAGGSYGRSGQAGQSGTSAGKVYGNAFGIPLLGGSGGSGANGTSGNAGGGGGAGGGALLIASSTSVTVNGQITARGGAGVAAATYSGGSGSGGLIKLMANYLVLGSEASVLATSQAPASSAAGLGGVGRIRFEAYNQSIDGEATVNPSASSGPPVEFSLPADFPGIRLISIDGQAITDPRGNPGNPDITLANPGPVPIVVGVRNIPVGVSVELRILSTDAPPQIIQSDPLTGSLDESSVTINVTLPAGLSQIIANVTFQPAKGLQTPDGETVAEVEITTDASGRQQTSWITESGRRVVAGSRN